MVKEMTTYELADGDMCWWMSETTTWQIILGCFGVYRHCIHEVFTAESGSIERISECDP